MRGKSSGFTLVEILVVTAILGILTVVAISVINPAKQIYKARDAKKHEDLNQIKAAMDLYYDDYHCYPTSFNKFGGSFTADDSVSPNGQQTVYLAKVPTAPDGKYTYMTDLNKSCPQWFVLFAKLSDTSGVAGQTTCPLFPLSAPVCHPLDDIGNHICVTGGTIEDSACAAISTQQIGD